MDENYEVKRNGKTVGSLELRREGLYCRLSCRCSLADMEIHRLYAGEEKLGVLVPERGALVLETKVAAKRIRPGCTFTLDAAETGFFPIRAGEPFGQLDRIREGKLVVRDGQMGLEPGAVPDPACEKTE